MMIAWILSIDNVKCHVYNEGTKQGSVSMDNLINELIALSTQVWVIPALLFIMLVSLIRIGMRRR